jgi:hypothetical protein
MSRTVRMEVGAILAVVVTLLAYSRIQAHRGSMTLETRTATAPEEAIRDETGEGGVESTEREHGGSDGQITSEASSGARRPPAIAAGTRGSSKDSRSGESHTEGTISQDPRIADPPVYYLDQADDAYGEDPWVHRPPNATASQKPFDILRVDWAPESNGYSTSLTVAGSARDDGWYVSYGHFRSNAGEYCQLYHILTPGTAAYANAFCGWVEDGSRRFVGRIEGTQVTSTPTAAGGTVVAGTFDNRAIPPMLEAAGRTLYTISAFTCAGESESGVADGLRCSGFEVLDEASSNATYRV